MCSSDLPCAGTTNHVVYVDGQAKLTGTWEMTGCIVATGKIIVNKPSDSGTITIHQWGNLPALMSKDSDVEIFDPMNIEGLVYANGWVLIGSSPGRSGPVVVYGALYGRNWVDIEMATELHYRTPNPPGLPAGTISIKTLSWSEG